jgi:uncharacterized protein (DUF2147 family)
VRTAKLGLAWSLVLLLGAAATAARAAVQNDVLGDWLTEDKRGVIRVGPCGDAFCGVIVGVSDWPANGDVLRDVHGQPQCHLAFIKHLKPEDDNRLHGTVTNPEDGTTYGAEMWVAGDGALRLRGYLALPILGSTQHWPRFHGDVQPDCHFHMAPNQ